MDWPEKTYAFVWVHINDPCKWSKEKDLPSQVCCLGKKQGCRLDTEPPAIRAAWVSKEG